MVTRPVVRRALGAYRRPPGHFAHLYVGASKSSTCRKARLSHQGHRPASRSPGGPGRPTFVGRCYRPAVRRADRGGSGVQVVTFSPRASSKEVSAAVRWRAPSAAATVSCVAPCERSDLATTRPRGRRRPFSRAEGRRATTSRVSLEQVRGQRAADGVRDGLRREAGRPACAVIARPGDRRCTPPRHPRGDQADQAAAARSSSSAPSVSMKPAKCVTWRP